MKSKKIHVKHGGKPKKELRAMGGPAKANLGKPARKSSGGDCYADGGKTDGKWMQGLSLKKGALHRELGVPADKKIPAGKLEKAAHSSNPTLKKRAVLAETFRKSKH